MKYLSGIFTLLFILVTIFAFLMCHEIVSPHHGLVHNDPCPTTIGTCMPDGTPMALHHISEYQSFSHAPLPFVVILLSTLLIIGMVNLFRFNQDSLEFYIPHKKCVKDRWREVTQHESFSQIHISQWLSLFENSPSRA